MAINTAQKKALQELKAEFDLLRKGKESLLVLVDQAEIPEAVYNSNAIENSTLTLKETERILLEMKLGRDVSIREVFEAKNLARVTEYIRGKIRGEDLSQELILLLHHMLIGNIDDGIAGRFRAIGEYVRVGKHVAPAPEQVERMIDGILLDYMSDHTTHPIEKIAKFHLDFETIHPFNDGNGRMGRVCVNYQLGRLGFPGIIIRDKEKKYYYESFHDYNDGKKTKGMEKVLMLALMESLHKRIAYLKGEEIITLAEYVKMHEASASATSNAARRQKIPAFRERGVWKIGINTPIVKV